jgi:MFS family permease
LKDVAQIDPALIGIVMGSLVVAIILVRPLMGRVSDRIGRRIPIVVGCIVSSLPLLAIPFVNLFPILLLLSVVYGIGFAAVIACTSALMCEVVSQEYTGTSMGFLDMTMDVGQTLGPIVCGWILASSLKYVGIFYSLTVVLLISCVIFAFSGVAKKSTKI